MRWRFYPTVEGVIWLVLTTIGACVSWLSLHEIHAGIQAIKRVALQRAHAEDVLGMAYHNRAAEFARLIAQVLFGVAGVLAMTSRPRIRVGRPRAIERVLPWILVGVEAILVGNSANEYALSRRILNRRVRIQEQGK